MYPRTLVSASHPVFANPEGTAISLMVVFEELSQHGPIPFIAHKDDQHDHGQEIFSRAISREFGIVGNYPLTIAQQVRALQASRCDAVDQQAEQVRQTFLTSGEGQALVYRHKVEEAKALQADDAPDPDKYPILSASVGIEGETLQHIAERVLATHGAWLRAAAAVEAARLGGKAKIKAAKTIDGVNAAFSAIKWPLIG